MYSIYSVVLFIFSCIVVSYAGQDFQTTQFNNSIWVGKPKKEIILNRYIKGEALEKLLEDIGKNFSSFVNVERIDDTEKDEISVLAVQISTDVRRKRELLKPQFKFVAGIHGDDAVGTALMVSLIQYLAYSYGHDDRITPLINKTDIWIVPSVNAYGFERANETWGLMENDKEDDLDSKFPDQFTWDNRLWVSPKRPEIFKMMLFMAFQPYNFVLSGNLQGGAIVANYPYNNREKNRPGVPSLTPDNKVFVKLAREYAEKNWMMAPGNACNQSFPGGITNGYQWKKRSGTMQDFNYQFTNCFELTFYLSCVRYPPAADLPRYWHANLNAILSFMESTRRGIYGLVKDTDGHPIVNANVEVEGNSKRVKTSREGEYWRLLLAGSHTITVTAKGYQSVTQKVEMIRNESYVRKDFMLPASKRFSILRFWDLLRNKE